MEMFNQIMTGVLLVALLILVVVVIILIIKSVHTVEKTNLLLDDLNNKMESVNGIFTAIDTFKEAAVTISDGVVGKIMTMLNKKAKKKKKEEDDEE